MRILQTVLALCLLAGLAPLSQADSPWQVLVVSVDRTSADEALVALRAAPDSKPLPSGCATLQLHVRFQALRWWTFNLLDGGADPTAGAWALNRGAHRSALDTLVAAWQHGSTVGFGLLHRGLGPLDEADPCEVQSNALMESDRRAAGSVIYSAFEWPRHPVLF